MKRSIWATKWFSLKNCEPILNVQSEYKSESDSHFSVSGGELFDRIVDENYAITEAEVRDYVRQILLAIQHMHRRQIVHLDLKVYSDFFKKPSCTMV